MLKPSRQASAHEKKMFRKSGKRGGRGRGAFSGGHDRENKTKKGYLPEELMSHYRRVTESLEQFDSEENAAELDRTKGEFVTNVVSSLSEELVQVCQNQTVSSIVESIISAASPANLRTLFVAAVTDLSVFFLDRFACHVMESLILRLPQFFDKPTLSSTEDEEDDVPQEEFLGSFETLCEFVDSQFEVLTTHAYGSHVLRAWLEALSGVSIAHELKKSQKSGYNRHAKKAVPMTPHRLSDPEKLRSLFDKYSHKLFRICDYEVHLKDPFFSLMLQAVLMILHKADHDACQTHCQDILHRVIASCSQSDSQDPTHCVADMAQDMAGSHLMEVMFKLSSRGLLQETFDSLLKGKLLYYAVHPTANHVLQTYIACVQDTTLLETLFEELSQHLEDILAVGYFGLVTSLADACRRLRVKQDDFIMVLMAAFHCKEPEERQGSLMRLIASFSTYEVFFSLDENQDKPTEGKEEPTLKGPVNMHGSQLIQQMLQFQKPKNATRGLLDLKPAEVHSLCCDPAGSHIVDVFFSSPCVSDNHKDIMLKKVKGLLLDIACTKNGSRCLENVWRSLTVAQRTQVAKQLTDSERIQSDRFGHFLHRNFNLGLFTSNKNKWLEQQGAATKRKKIMMEILQKTEPPSKKKRFEDRNTHEQKENEIEDSVTALFIQQKKSFDARQRDAAQRDTTDNTDQDEHTEHSRNKKKKKKKMKTEETTQGVLQEEKKKTKKVKRMMSETSGTVEERVEVKKKKKKNVTQKMAESSETVEVAEVKKKKKKKIKSDIVTEDIATPAKCKKTDRVKSSKEKVFSGKSKKER